MGTTRTTSPLGSAGAVAAAGTGAPDRMAQGALLAAVGSGVLLSTSARLVENGALLLTLPAALLALPGVGLVWHARDLLRCRNHHR